MSYQVGDRAQPPADFGVDQTTITATVRAPDGTTTNYSGAGVQHDSVGVYHVDYVTSQTGEHEFVFTGDTDSVDGVFDVHPLLTADPPDGLQTGALCSLKDVADRVPGYTPGDDDDIDDILRTLILQESQDFLEATGREIVPMNADTVRTFDLTSGVLARGTLAIGDVAAVAQVELFDYDGTTSLGVIASSSYVLTPRTRRSWQPYTRIWFPIRPNQQPLLLAPGRTIKITGTFGYPAIPTTVRRAVAVLTLFRYLNDVAPAGTALGDLADKADFNLAASLKVALDTRDRFNRGPFA